MHSNNTHLPAIPELSAHYTNQAQYLSNYPAASHHYSHSQSALPRITSHHDVHHHPHHPHHSRGTGSASPDSQWPSPQIMTPVDPIEPYVSRPDYGPDLALTAPPPFRYQFPSPQERNLVGSSSHATHHVRYQ